MGAKDRLVGTKIADRYCITGEIGAGGMGRVFRAMPFNDPSQDVAIKVILRNKSLDSEDLLRFQKEAALMSRLHHPNIICFHELGILQGDEGMASGLGPGYYIVMEIANGRNLKESLIGDSRKDLAFFFEIGLQISAALDYTHGKNIIHRDIKPQNIVVGKAWKEQRGVLVKVLDFGVARLTEVVQREQNGAAKEKLVDIAGTPLYMAPEQTPLLDAPVDHRVDLYSLGCVLYEILAGRPPFTAKSRDKLMRQHVAETPESLTTIRPDIPPIIEEIVHKLLAKHPDDRYQTAFGLHADLQRAKAALQSRSRQRHFSFTLGLKDGFKAMSANLELVGRRHEYDQLINNYLAIRGDRGRSRLTVLRGAAGMGKTRLLTEFRSYLSRRKIRFISASFSRHENNLPFNALANGFNEYLIRILKSQPHEAEEVKRKVKTLLGGMAHKVAEVVPGLKGYIDPSIEEVIEEEKKPQEGDDPEARLSFQTFAKAFSDFTRCLASDTEPFVFIFDDMQWADEKSLELIDQFFSHNNSQRFFMIIGYRPLGELEPEQFSAFIQKFRKMRRRYEEIEMRPLSHEEAGILAGEMLNSPASVNEPLVDYLCEKTSGNPMHLVEYLKALVAQEFINRDARTNVWVYNLEHIRESRIILDSVDLTLTRIETFDRTDRNILEIASVIGLTFQFELLLADPEVQAVRAMKALHRAMLEGLIIRMPDDEELKHLGKSYSFSHRVVREAILDSIAIDRRRELHRLVALALQKAMASSGPKNTFTLAHHINQVISGAQSVDVALAEKGIMPNINAGKVAAESGSWQSAQHYFESAYLLLKSLPDAMTTKRAKAYVMEQLADIATHQSRNSAAIKLYAIVQQMALTPEAFANAAFKCTQLKIIAGQISDAVVALKRDLTKLRYPWPLSNPLRRMQAQAMLFWDLLGLSAGRYLQFLKRLALLAKQNPALPQFYNGVNIYHAGQAIYLKDDPGEALLFHDAALRECIKGRASYETMIRTVADRALLLGYYGRLRRAYRILDAAIDTATRIEARAALGYMILQRTLTLDTYKSKFDELEQNIELALNTIPRDQDRLYYTLGILAQMQLALFRGQFERLRQTSKTVHNLISTRSWLSPKGVALHLFSLFMEDSRDAVVLHGEAYLRRRSEVGGRTNELYVHVINVMIALAKGEVDRTRKVYSQLVTQFLAEAEYLYPFEEDFISFFILIQPDLFIHEHRKSLVSAEDEVVILKNLATRARSSRHRHRGVAKLILARWYEKQNSKRARYLYDEALATSRISGNILVQLLAYYWFGRHLLQAGQDKRKDYLLKAQGEGARYNLNVLVDLAERCMQELKIEFTSIKMSKGSTLERHTQQPMAPSVHQHLTHICDVMRLDTAMEGHLHESITLLQRSYRFAKATCFLVTKGSDELEMVYPLEDAAQESIMQYVTPYLNIRSTLFLPVSDAPWYQRRSGERDDSSLSFSKAEDLQSMSEDMTKTQVLSETLFEELGGTIVLGTTNLSNENSQKQVVRDRRSQPSGKNDFMNTLVPIRFNGRSIGLILLEKIRINSENSVGYRHELDQIGAQLGLMIQRKSDIEFIRNLASTSHLHQAGQYLLENVPWLNLWSQGRLRKDRESTWYLGLSLGDDYLLVYCRLNGPDQVRRRLSEELWYHMLVLRSLAVAGGKNTYTLVEIREELVSLLKRESQFALLDAVSFSFTIFNQENRQALSGHFGPTRPLVLCAENDVTPYNEAVLNLATGRVLRYWEVKASLHGVHTYILPHDSSKLDGITMDSLEPSMTGSKSVRARSENLVKLLDRVLLKENVPRYYVAAMLNEGGDTAGTLPRAQ